MDGEQTMGFSEAALADALARSLEKNSLDLAERSLVAQAYEDLRTDELTGVAVSDLAAALASFWRFAERRTPSAPSLRLAAALGADARDLGVEVLEIVQDDAPFLVDSVMGELTEAGLSVRAMLHPVIAVARDAEGLRTDAGRALPESMILVALEPVGEDRRVALLDNMRATLSDVRTAVADFPAMTELMSRTAAELAASPAPSEPYGMAEYQAFLRWVNEERFVFLGARVYAYPRTPEGGYAAEEPAFLSGESLGVLRDPARSVLRRQSEPAILASQLTDYLSQGAPLVVAKSNLRSRVHRRGYMDYIGIKRYGADGRAWGEVRFVGLFTSEAYAAPAHEIPLVRRKLDHVYERAVKNPSTHTKNRLRRIVDTYPRDELFQIGEADLLATAMGILHLYDRPRVRLFTRTDGFDRFVSVLLFVPRDRYDTEVRERAGAILARAYDGRVSAFYPSFSEDTLVRVHFVIGVSPGAHARPDLPALEAEIADAARTWADRFEARARNGGVAEGLVSAILARYADAFPVGYRALYDAEEALLDLVMIEGQGEAEPLRVRAYRLAGDCSTCFRFKLYRSDSAIALADVLPILDNMGLKAMSEEGFPVVRRLDDGTETTTWVHEFALEDAQGERLTFADVKAPFEQAFIAVWAGHTESDGFNRLVLELGVSWREAALVRTLARFRQQTGLDPSEAAQTAALSAFPHVAQLILDAFRIKFDPALQATLEERARQAEAVLAETVAALDAVESLDADRVLRRLALLVRAAKRTNFYRAGEEDGLRPCISVKFASQEIEQLPAPRPYREVFVWAPHVEGVHLRFGPVARGGLRWSDRRDDFRTEVLGLVKAQQVKNAVIVPVGAKGGFYPKALPRGAAATPDTVRAEGVRAYKTFLSGLLDITDNYDAEGRVIRPEGVIAHEGDDPYLVVAADKGTASFSDIANGVAHDYGFWLDDAFASGGSHGYDHKVMGITARGAWVAVERHFREMGRDVQTEPFTCIGVGDMSGDVFGNGMLLSRQTRLLAAFDHRHVFVDPDPDPDVSWAERKRLFDLPRSSWADYDPALISPGGGVHPRTAKSIELSDPVRALLCVDAASLSPVDLIRAVLRAPADLLYLGGIGTYVKAASESHADVGDKSTDAVRVDAIELRVKVVGEGANLGVTQAGRIAFAKLGNDGAGGRIDTDAIDNSAGVDTSDHEVNIKILLGQAERAGTLAADARDALLASMTGEVAAHVLAHNEAQTLGLSLQAASAAETLDSHERFMARLVSAGRLDRAVEGLPRTSAVTDLRAAGRGLTRPELAVVTAYGKLELSATLTASAAPDDPYFERTLLGYFPRALVPFEDEMRRHRLRREIISTVLANEIVDLAGPTFPTRLMAAANADARTLAVAFEVARQVFRLDEAWAATVALDGRTPVQTQTLLLLEIAAALRGQTYWLARHAQADGSGVRALIDVYQPAADSLRQAGFGLLSPFERDAAIALARGFVEAGAPESLAAVVAGLRPLTATAAIALLAQASAWPPVAAARVYHEVGGAFRFDRLRASAAAVRGADPYERTALRGLIVEMINEQVGIARAVIAQAPGPQAGESAEAATAAIDAWAAPRRAGVDQALRTLDAIEQSGGGWSFAKLTIANAALRQAASARVEAA